MRLLQANERGKGKEPARKHAQCGANEVTPQFVIHQKFTSFAKKKRKKIPLSKVNFIISGFKKNYAGAYF